MVRTLTAFGN